MTEPPDHTPSTPSPEIDAEDKRRHLEIIQAVIARLANSGAETKHWAVTLGGTAFGVSALNGLWYLAFIGLVVVTSFSILNNYYLYEERLFRQLYCAAVRNEVDRFDMRKDRYKDCIDSRAKTYFSWSIVGFFGALLAGGVIAMGIGLLNADTNGEDHRDPPWHKRSHESALPARHPGL